MLEPVINYQAKSNDDLKQYADICFAQLSGRHAEAHNHFLLREIDALLQKHEVGYIEGLFALINHPEYEDAAALNYNLTLLKQIYEICSVEIEEGKIPVLCKLTALDDVERIYDTTYFLLRRLETNLPAEYCMELANWVKEMDLSAAFLLLIIEKGRILYKIHTAEMAAGIFISQGQLLEAEKLLVWVRDQKEKNR